MGTLSLVSTSLQGFTVYNGVSALADEKVSGGTKISAGANLGLVATTAVIGSVTVFSSGETRPKLKIAHQILGYSLSASSLWFAIQNSSEKCVPKHRKALGWVGFGGTTIHIVGATVLF